MLWSLPKYRSLAEEIANYDYIKKYMAQYMPNVPLGLGIGADKYLTDLAYASVANANFRCSLQVTR